MSDSSKNSFEERLKRIETGKGTSGSIPGTSSSDKSTNSTPDPVPFTYSRPKNRKRLFHPVFLLVAACFGASAYVFGPAIKEFGNALNQIGNLQDIALQRQQDVISALNGDEPGQEKPIQSDPSAYDRQQEHLGYAFGSSFAVAQGHEAVPLETIFADFTPTGPETPAPTEQVKTLAANAECTIRPVGPDEKLVNVNIRHARGISPIQVTDKAVVLETLNDAAKDALNKGKSIASYPHNPRLVSLVNVLVTDTSGPLYLALQSLTEDVLWSLHLAPGVEIAHVAVITADTAGISGLPSSASHEHVKARDYNTDFSNPYYFRRDPENMECMARPFRKPDETWLAWAGSRNGNSLDGNLLYGQDQGFAAYAHWYTTQTSESPATNLIDAQTASHVLVGPVPEAPLVPQSNDTWYITPHEYYFAGGTDAQNAAYEKLAAEFAEQAASGNPFDTIPEQEILKLMPEGTQLATIVGELPSIFGVPVVNNPVTAVVDRNEINKRREVTFSGSIPFDAILAPGEETQENDYLDLVGMLRGPALFENKCSAALANIAQRCELVSGSMRRSGSEKFDFSMTFGYIPNYNLGTYKMSVKNAFERVVFREKAENKTFQKPDQQVAFVAKLQNVCDGLKSKFGNCVITSAAFTDGRDESSSARGVLSVYYSENKFEQSKIAQEAERLYQQIAH